eukprot:12774216-Ditylum_brightwellii.AAC.1
MNGLWADYGDNEEKGIPLVDARNAFNELKCMSLLWHVHGMLSLPTVIGRYANDLTYVAVSWPHLPTY